jgi:hypothetical protein
MIERLQIPLYAANILYVLAVGVSKLSAIAFVSRLACTPGNRNAVVLLAGLVMCWTIAITAGIIFECELPRPWEVLTGDCIPMVRTPRRPAYRVCVLIYLVPFLAIGEHHRHYQ